MAQPVAKPKENFQALLHAPIDWDSANLFRPDDYLAYIGIHHSKVHDRKTPFGTRFRCYYAPNGGTVKEYRLVLFEIQPAIDTLTKQSYRGLIFLALETFPENIWGKQF